MAITKHILYLKSTRPLVKSAYQKIKLLNSQQKHMLWVLQTYERGSEKRVLKAFQQLLHNKH